MDVREQAALDDLHPIERELVARERAAAASGSPLTLDQLRAEYERILAERDERLMRDANASWRSMEGWGNVATREEWLAAVREADEEYDSGDFLLSRLGAHRYLDPPLMAVLLLLRRRLIDEHGAATAAELMLIDSAVIAYYHQLRIGGWVGDLAQWLEAEFFRKGGLTVARRHESGRPGRRDPDRIRGLTVEEIVERLADKLMPLLDRSNRMMLRNLAALRAMREGPSPSVSIGAAAQVNVGTQHVTTTGAPRKV